MYLDMVMVSIILTVAHIYWIPRRGRALGWTERRPTLSNLASSGPKDSITNTYIYIYMYAWYMVYAVIMI